MFQTMILSLNQNKNIKECVTISAYVDNDTISRYGKGKQTSIYILLTE